MNQAEFDRRYALISERLEKIARQEAAAGGSADATESWARKQQLLEELERLLSEYERA